MQINAINAKYLQHRGREALDNPKWAGRTRSWHPKQTARDQERCAACTHFLMPPTPGPSHHTVSSMTVPWKGACRILQLHRFRPQGTLNKVSDFSPSLCLDLFSLPSCLSMSQGCAASTDGRDQASCALEEMRRQGGPRAAVLSNTVPAATGSLKSVRMYRVHQPQRSTWCKAPKDLRERER